MERELPHDQLDCFGMNRLHVDDLTCDSCSSSTTIEAIYCPYSLPKPQDSNNKMASRILLPSRLPMFVGFGASSLLLSPLSPLMQRRVLHLDSSPVSASPKDWSFSQYERDAKVPIVKKRGGLNPKAVKQLSTGSILGLMGGLAVSTFSKSLALLIGLMIFGVQVCYTEHEGADAARRLMADS